MTNIEKYKHYADAIDKIVNDYCMSFFPDELPEYFYVLGTDFTKYECGSYIKEAKVTSVGYFSCPPLKPYFNKRPTNNIVDAIKKTAESLTVDNMEEDNIRIHVEARDSIGKSSWAIKYEDIKNGSASASKEDLEGVLQEKIQHYKDFYLVKDGQFPCAYCRKAVGNDKKVTKDVISRQYPNFRKSFDYCSDLCAAHDQMAHEG